MNFKKVFNWIVDNRRILGTICGSILIVFGYEKEGSYISNVTSHL